jgi:hypothetical protein
MTVTLLRRKAPAVAQPPATRAGQARQAAAAPS